MSNNTPHQKDTLQEGPFTTTKAITQHTLNQKFLRAGGGLLLTCPKYAKLIQKFSGN